jgi:recombination protein RecT
MNEVVHVQERTLPPAAAVRAELEKMTPQFALALPPHVSPERYVRIVMTAVQSNPALLSADRQTLFQACMKCAQDGLLPDGREAALVIFRTKKKIDGRDAWVDAVQYMPMVAGVIAKVRRSGELLTIGAHVVYAEDRFIYSLGDDEKIEHEPFMGSDRGSAIAAYAVAKTKDGGIYREVMSVDEINQVRNVSRAKDSGPWVSWWGEMARKTVIRRLSKRLPMSTDLQAVIERDDELYDLRQASGAALPTPNLAARLAAPQDGPREGFTTVHASPLGDDDIPDFDAGISPGAASEEPASDGSRGPRTDAGDDFPGDAPTTSREEQTAGPAEPNGDEGTGPAVDVLQRVDRVIAEFEFKTLAELKETQADRRFVAFVAAIRAQSPEQAERVEKALAKTLESFG